MSLLDKGFKEFEAKIKQVQDKSQHCKVTLAVKGPKINKTYEGKTGNDHGHAEMDALNEFIEDLLDTVVYAAIDGRVSEEPIEVDPQVLTGDDRDKGKIDNKTARSDAYVAKSAVSYFNNYTLTLTCDKKSCCRKCSSVLGHLGIGAGDETFKTEDNMDHTQYGVSNKVKEFIRAYLERKGYSKDEINKFFVDLAG